MSEEEVIERLDFAAARNNNAAALSAKTKAILAGMGLGLNVVEAEIALREQLEAKEVVVPDGADLFEMIPLIGSVKGEVSNVVAKAVFGDTNNVNTRLEAFVSGEMSELPEASFSGWNNLFSIDILSDSITRIGKNCFKSCTNLTNVNLRLVEQIWEHAFWQCYGLKEIVIPKNVWLVDYGAFSICQHLERVTFESSIPQSNNGNYLRLGEQAFLGCENLKEVHFKGRFRHVSGEIDTFETLGGMPIDVYFEDMMVYGQNAGVDGWGWPSGSVLHFVDGDLEIS